MNQTENNTEHDDEYEMSGKLRPLFDRSASLIVPPPAETFHSVLGKLDMTSGGDKTDTTGISDSTPPPLIQTPYLFFAKDFQTFSKTFIPVAAFAIVVGAGLWYKTTQQSSTVQTSSELPKQIRTIDPIKLIDSVSAEVTNESLNESEAAMNKGEQEAYLASDDSINENDYNDDQL